MQGAAAVDASSRISFVPFLLPFSEILILGLFLATSIHHLYNIFIKSLTYATLEDGLCVCRSHGDDELWHKYIHMEFLLAVVVDELSPYERVRWIVIIWGMRSLGGDFENYVTSLLNKCVTKPCGYLQLIELWLLFCKKAYFVSLITAELSLRCNFADECIAKRGVSARGHIKIWV